MPLACVERGNEGGIWKSAARQNPSESELRHDGPVEASTLRSALKGLAGATDVSYDDTTLTTKTNPLRYHCEHADFFANAALPTLLPALKEEFSMSAPNSTHDQLPATFEDRVRAFRAAVLNEDAAAADEAGEDLVGYLWDPKSSAFVTRAVFELSRAMNEAPSRAIRVIVQAHQAYALESLAEQILEVDSDGPSADDNGGEEVTETAAGHETIAKPLQHAA